MYLPTDWHLGCGECMVPPQTALALPMSVPEKSFEPEAGCPLDGVRVVDMSRLVSGNMVSLQLADFGAEVIKIEDPKKGDPLRAWQTDGVSVHWKVYSRNKKSVALSLRAPRGRELLADLIADAAGADREFPPGHARGDGARARRAASAQSRAGYRPGLRLGPGRALPRPARLRHPGREHVGLCRAHRLCRSRAGLAADRARRHGRRALRRDGGAWWRCARSRSRAATGQVIDLPLLDPLFSFIATEAAIYRLTGPGPRAHRQPLGDDLAAQRLPHQGRALYRHFGLDPGDGRAAVPRDRP